MKREYQLELRLRNIMNCNRPQRLLTFGGIITADSLKYESGTFYTAIVSSLALIYHSSSIDTCDAIDNFISELDDCKNCVINDISEDRYNEILETFNSLINS